MELEQTWRDGAPAVARAIACGVLHEFPGPGGIPYVGKRHLNWGRNQSVDINIGIKKAIDFISINRRGHSQHFKCSNNIYACHHIQNPKRVVCVGLRMVFANHQNLNPPPSPLTKTCETQNKLKRSRVNRTHA